LANSKSPIFALMIFCSVVMADILTPPVMRCPNAAPSRKHACHFVNDVRSNPYFYTYCELADLDASEYDQASSGLWTRGLLIRRHIADGDLVFFSTWCPAGSQRNPLLAWLAPPCFTCHARVCHDGRDPPSHQHRDGPANETPDLCGPPLIRWSIQEIRRIANRLAQRRIAKAHVIAWSLWRRAHQAAAKRAHLRLKQKMQL